MSFPSALLPLSTMHRHQRDALVYDPSDNAVKDVTAYGIACVFTPASNRQHGYARHMMRLVHWVVGNASFRASHPFPAAWGTPPSGPGDGVFSVLWSDVGPDFYHRAGEGEARGGGWRVVGPLSSVIPVSPDSSVTVDAGDWRTLDLAQAEAQWAEDAVLIRKDLAAAGHAHSDQTIAAFLPDRGVAAFQPFRSIDAITGKLPFTDWGIQLQAQDGLSSTWATWCFELWAKPPSLLVTRLRVPDVLHFKRLVPQLLRAAADAGVAEVEFWNLSDEFRDAVAAAGGRTFERNDHLPAIKYYGEVAEENVQLMFNEKLVSSLLEP
jgi:hypothetical protein